ncbi:cell envelope biogenesis protein TolA [Bradyrhizobium sp. S3.5.5]|uniref:cell envelope biogenesis protein TolA n=1 Tax=Bradyrhizobium sp. S3.5.5 TaxID=3156430 RepID=UPI00339A5D5B
MAKKLKTFQTSLGFFDQAIAAPSMKAALEAWGADSNLFHQGVARESDDHDVIAATMAKPGVVLKRPVGTDGPFLERAQLPTDIGRARAPSKKADKTGRKETRLPTEPVTDRKLAAAYVREEERRRRALEEEETARQKARERQQRTFEEAQGALDAARQQHDEKARGIRTEIEKLEERLRAEDARWDKEKSRLDDLLLRARK